MANPQKERGFTPIANEILEALARQRLRPREWQILMLLLRESYGHQRKEAILSLREISQRTGIRKEHCSKVLKHMGLLNLATGARVADSGNHHKTIHIFQKDYHRWGVTKLATVANSGNGSVTKVVTPSNREVVKERKDISVTPAVRRLITAFYKRQTDALGSRPMSFPGGQAGRFFKTVLARGMTEEEIGRKISAWFENPDPYGRKEGFRFGAFVSKFDSLGVAVAVQTVIPDWR